MYVCMYVSVLATHLSKAFKHPSNACCVGGGIAVEGVNVLSTQETNALRCGTNVSMHSTLSGTLTVNNFIILPNKVIYYF